MPPGGRLVGGLIMDESLGKYFGLFIAYTCPGFVALWGVGSASKTVGAWFDTVANVQASVPGAILLVLAATGVGVFVAGCRWVIFDRLLKRWFPRVGAAVDNSKRADPNVSREIQTINATYFTYFEFHANGVCAMLFAFAMWASFRHGWSLDLWPYAIVALVVIVLMLIAAHGSWMATYSKTLAILGPARKEAHA